MDIDLDVSVESQSKMIKEFLLNGGRLTQLKALKLFGCMRLASRINDLRNEGMDIITKMEKRGKKRFAVYYIKPQVAGDSAT